MTKSEKYYKKNLYPFQDGILAIARNIEAPFYLTGGTAISRHYCPVRYSEDLDLFVNKHPEFSKLVDKFYAELEKESAKGLFSIEPKDVVDLWRLAKLKHSWKTDSKSLYTNRSI